MLRIDGSFKSIGHVSLDRLSLGLTDRSGIIMTTIEPPKRVSPRGINICRYLNRDIVIHIT